MAANNPLFDFSQPRVMAILNVTPDSFFAGSRMPDAPHVERRVREAVAEGASIIDVGGYSSRPGADEVSPGEEWRRVELGVEAVRRLAPGMAVSVDTFRSEVAARAIERFGPLIINDISAGELDPAMPAVAAKYGVPYIAMHMKGDPKTMQSLTDYKRDITAEVVAYFEARVAALLVLLYGARTDRIHRLTTVDTSTAGGRTYLALSTEPIEIPNSVAQLFAQLVKEAEQNPGATRRAGEGSYLFPSPRRHHEPIHPTTLGRWIARAGVSPRIARNYAMLALASDLPAAIVAVQMGITPQTASRWSQFSQRDNSEFVAARADFLPR